jgi:UrcA family protein
MMNSRNIAAGLALILAASPTAAQGGPVVVEGGVPSTSVSYADLDLSSAAGRRTLEWRVAKAASGLCVEQGRKPIRQELAERRCLSTALTRAEADIQQAVASAEVRMASRSVITLAAK